MSCRSLATALVLSSALLPLAAAHAAPCQGATAGALAIGQVVRLEPGPARALAIELASGQGVIADLSTLDTPAAKDGEGEDGDNAKAPPRNIAIFRKEVLTAIAASNQAAAVRAPQPGSLPVLLPKPPAAVLKSPLPSTTLSPSSP